MCQFHHCTHQLTHGNRISTCVNSITAHINSHMVTGYLRVSVPSLHSQGDMVTGYLRVSVPSLHTHTLTHGNRISTYISSITAHSNSHMVTGYLRVSVPSLHTDTDTWQQDIYVYQFHHCTQTLTHGNRISTCIISITAHIH